MTQAHIVSASRPDAEWVADLIGDSFQHLSVSAWLLPDPADRAKVLPRNFQIYVEYALTYGVVHVFADRSAAAVWLPRGFGDLPPPDDYDRRLEEVCGAAIERFRHLDEMFDANHPHEPHHHLAFLGVSPAHQRSGLGSQLLEHHHATLDRENIAGFLEASSTGARDLYQRMGYRLMGEPYTVGGAPFWPMWREPRSPSQ